MAQESLNVLLVEDDEEDFIITRRLLLDAPNQHFELKWTTTLAAGLEVLARDPLDVVLLDFSLPDSHGWETLRRILERASAVPVIFLTGLDDETLGLESVKRGAQDFLIKGATDRKQLVRAIRYAIERKRAEEALKVYRDHLEDLVKRRTEQLRTANEALQSEIDERTEAEIRLREAVARLEDHNQAKTDFVSNVSHELRTPLSSMSNVVENLLKGVVGELTPRLRTYVEMLDDDCGRLIGVVNDILDLSRIEANRLVLNRVKLPFARFALESVESLRAQADSKLISLSVRGENKIGFVDCDPQKMTRVLINVVHNAIKFTPRRGAIEIDLDVKTEPEERFLIRIIDSGVGIGPEHIDKVTERYYRVGEHITGTGLGLALCKEIVELHGGRLSLLSPPQGREKGTEVSIAMPTTSPPLVVAIDDDESVRELLETQLSVYGYRVLTCVDGKDVIPLLKEKQPNVLLLDLVLPEPDGVEIVAMVKAEHTLRHIPIIVVTGAEMDRAKTEILEGFAVPALSKPWKHEELLRCVEDAMIGKQYVTGQG